MEKILLTSTVLALLVTAGNSPLRAADALPSPDAVALSEYADQLHAQGVKGKAFTARLDQKFSDLRKAALTPPPNLPANPVPPVPGKEPAAEGPGMGSYVQQLHAQGLRGTALAAAIHTELRRRGVGEGHGKPGGPKPDAPSDKGKPGVEPDNAPKSKSPSAPGPGTSPSKGKGKARARKCRHHRRRSSP